MKHLLLTLLALALFSPTLFAQWTQLAGPEGGTVYCIERAGNVILAGSNSGLFISEDDGSSWQRDPSVSLSDNILRIVVSGDTVLLLVSENKPQDEPAVYRLFVRTSPNAPWNERSTPINDYGFYTKNLFFNHFGLYLSGGGKLFQSFNLGASWTPVTYPTGMFERCSTVQDRNRIVLDGATVNGLEDFNVFSDDGGSTWQTMPAFPNGYDYSDLYVDNNLIILPGYGLVNLQRSEDFGISWQEIPYTAPNHIYISKIRRADDDHLYALGTHLFRSEDDGLTWNLIATDGFFDMLIQPDNSYLFTDNSVGVVKGNSELTQFTPSNTHLNASNVADQFVSPEGTIYASCLDGLFVSKDLGATWNLCASDSTLPRFERVYEMLFLGDTLVGAAGSKIYLSTDNGDHWSAMPLPNSPHASFFYGLEYFNNKLYVGARRIFVTDDWGQSWQTNESSEPYYSCNDLLAVGARLFAVFSNGKIVYSDNEGQSWTLCNDLWTPGAYRNNRLGIIQGALFAYGEQPPQYSTNNGMTWIQTGSQGLPMVDVWDDPKPIISIVGLDSLLYISIAWEGVFVSADFGQTWNTFTDGLGFRRPRALDVADNTLYLSTTTASIWRWGSLPINVEEVFSESESKEKVLFYPNPAPSGSIVTATWLQAYQGKIDVGFFNQEGRNVYHTTEWMSGQNLVMKLPALPGGMYQVIMKNSVGATTGKLVVLKH